MSEVEGAIVAEAKVEDAVLSISAKVDIIAALAELAKKTENSIDDSLVKIVEAARDGADWKGVAKKIL